MKKKVAGLFFVSALLFSAAAGLLLVDSAKANGIPLPKVPVIGINGDGSITPETDLISRNGNTYTLTANVNEYEISIGCSNIVFDGAGHTINITKGDNSGLSLGSVSNVTIKNVEVQSSYTNIHLYYSSNCTLTDVKANNRIYLLEGDSNVITKSSMNSLHVDSNDNSISKNSIFVELFVGGRNNIFSKNNFLFEDLPIILYNNIWDDGSVGNYWGNYSTRYPDAREIGNTGIGNMPYVIERDTRARGLWDPNATNIDRYPLIYPYDIEKDAIAFPAREPLSEPEPFPTALAVGASGASIAIIGVGLLVYFKKRKH